MKEHGFEARVGAQDTRNPEAVTDDALLDRVGAMLRSADPFPRAVTDAARELLTWQTVDAELAELLRGERQPAPPAGR